MILPIHVYGDSVLREPAAPVTVNSDELQELIDSMVETMRGASGIGLAAPQVGRSLRLFIVDMELVLEQAGPEEKKELGISQEDVDEVLVVINPEVLEESDLACDFEEGCLSIPGVAETVSRSMKVRVKYLDRSFEEQEIEAGGRLARILLHEYDHLEGVLFVDRLSTLRRRLLKRQLRQVKNGQAEAAYPLAQVSSIED